ncbi:MAG: LysE family transporter [Saprospiraceae bacterium]|nr:LysE family transporter [Saprospiraceae bacterium]
MGKIIASAFLLGLVFKVTPGPVFTETIRHGLRGGFRSAFSVQVGAIVGDTVWAVIGIVSIGFIYQLRYLETPIKIASIFYLLWLAWNSWRDSNRNFLFKNETGKTTSSNSIRSGLFLSFTNPQNIMYWAAIGSSLSGIGFQKPTANHYFVFYAFFMISTIMGAFAISILVNILFQRVDEVWARNTYRLCSFAFLVLAILLLLEIQSSC